MCDTGASGDSGGFGSGLADPAKGFTGPRATDRPDDRDRDRLSSDAANKGRAGETPGAGSRDTGANGSPNRDAVAGEVQRMGTGGSATASPDASRDRSRIAPGVAQGGGTLDPALIRRRRLRGLGVSGGAAGLNTGGASTLG